jgi:hypothetical protein
MKIISHRGNLTGPGEQENSPEKIEKVIKRYGLDVEIDLWYTDRCFYLGHDRPEHKISIEFLRKNRNKLWIHIKNIDCLDQIAKEDFNWFWHETDKMTLTKKGQIWFYPGHFGVNGITVVNDKDCEIPSECYGICTDYALFYMNGEKA